MKIQIEDKLFLEADNLSFQIKEYNGKTDSNGKELFKVHGYYSTLPSAVKGLVKRKVKETTAENLSELIVEVVKLEKFIDSKFKGEKNNG